MRRGAHLLLSRWLRGRVPGSQKCFSSIARVSRRRISFLNDTLWSLLCSHRKPRSAHLVAPSKPTCSPFQPAGRHVSSHTRSYNISHATTHPSIQSSTSKSSSPLTLPPLPPPLAPFHQSCCFKEPADKAVAALRCKQAGKQTSARAHTHTHSTQPLFLQTLSHTADQSPSQSTLLLTPPPFLSAGDHPAWPPGMAQTHVGGSRMKWGGMIFLCKSRRWCRQAS